MFLFFKKQGIHLKVKINKKENSRLGLIESVYDKTSRKEVRVTNTPLHPTFI